MAGVSVSPHATPGPHTHSPLKLETKRPLVGILRFPSLNAVERLRSRLGDAPGMLMSQEKLPPCSASSLPPLPASDQGWANRAGARRPRNSPGGEPTTRNAAPTDRGARKARPQRPVRRLCREDSGLNGASMALSRCPTGKDTGRLSPTLCSSAWVSAFPTARHKRRLPGSSLHFCPSSGSEPPVGSGTWLQRLQFPASRAASGTS